ncbi:hypothetical protein [Streptomyces sp. WG7]
MTSRELADLLGAHENDIRLDALPITSSYELVGHGLIPHRSSA